MTSEIKFEIRFGCSRRMWAWTHFEHKIHTLFKVCSINVQYLFKIQTLFTLCSNLVQIKETSSMYVHYTFILCSAYSSNEQTMFKIEFRIHSMFKLYSNFKLCLNLLDIKNLKFILSSNNVHNSNFVRTCLTEVPQISLMKNGLIIFRSFPFLNTWKWSNCKLL